MIRPLICNIKRIVAAVLLLSAISVESAAQVDAGFTQYMEVPSYYNPAAIGLTDYLRIRGGSRLQWMGIPKAPQNFPRQCRHANETIRKKNWSRHRDATREHGPVQ